MCLIQNQDIRLTEYQQQIVVLEGTIETHLDTLSRQEASLEKYKQQFQAATDQAAAMETSLGKVTEDMTTLRAKVQEREDIKSKSS